MTEEVEKFSVSEEEKKKLYYPLPELAENARLKNMDDYKALYEQSISDPDAFWAKEAEMLSWIEPYTQVWQAPTGNQDDFVGKWFVGGKLNAAYNCCDRWAEKYPDALALVCVGELDEVKKFTYAQLTEEVCKTANVLKALGISKGDRVCIWLPMISELPIFMLACARIGAIHSVVFGGFAADSVKDRVLDSECKLLVVSDEVRRSGQNRPMKATLEGVIDDVTCLEHICVVKLTGGEIPWNDRDVWYHELLADASTDCPCEPMDAEDPLFVLYTSGTTGKPKGAVHTTAGFLVYGMSTNKYVWDYSCLLDLKGVEPDQRDMWYCTADIGWITGHTQIVYAPLSLGAQTLMYEGV
ncbi:MAG TPA: AMP-binding protein, partial [Candidatus Lokiarchaeia archaeon]|nr:AMP-binding protein [Candidatus Lokiarchaeia archaeon]